MASSNGHSAGSGAPRAVPGSYGFPVIGNLRDRHDFYYRQGQDKYFESRIEQYGSTVLCINVPRGPFFTIDPQVVALLDAKSFPTLFDVTKVEKKDVLVGYVPPLSITGGYRILSYLDPFEPNHGKLKQLMFTLLHSRRDAVVPAFRSNFSSLLDGVDSKLAAGGGGPVDFNKLNDVSAFQFLGEAFFGERPAPELSSSAGKWLLLMLSPLFTIGLPWIIEEPLLHSVPLPSILVRKDYKAFYDYVFAAATKALDTAESLGFTREEACHNLLFMMGLNSYAAFKLMLPTILGSIAGAKDLHARLAAEIRGAVADAGGVVTLAAVERMELTKSVVWEAVRLDPPVKYQYGHAKMDLEIESHDAVYKVKKGQMLMGYQPCATRDPRVFGPTAREFVGDRFVGEEGRELIKYVYWSNGRETEEPTVGNKQCPGKNFVMLVGRLFVVELFLRYDTFSVQFTKGPAGNKVAFTDVTKATAS